MPQTVKPLREVDCKEGKILRDSAKIRDDKRRLTVVLGANFNKILQLDKGLRINFSTRPKI